MISNKVMPEWQDQEALRRYLMITPLLDEELDTAKKTQLREKIAADNDISIRTVYRYEESYRENQFAGLKPADRKQTVSPKLPGNFDFLLEQAIQLRKEVPERSVKMIIDTLEMEGHVAPGVLKRSTLQRHMFEKGFGTMHLKIYKDARKSSSKRYCKPNRMMLVQADIKYGLKLPIGKNGAKVQTYLSSAIDDHSRFILASKFYDNQEDKVVSDTFRQAIQCFGRMDGVYFDNGTQYIAKQIRFSLAKLGIKVHFAPKNSGQSKGKIEKFHQVVDAFLREAKLKKVKTLEELNRLWSLYLNDYYQTDSHDGIKEYYKSLGVTVAEAGISPLQEWNRDKRPLTYLDTSVVAEAFLYHEERKVDKGACISFQGKKYETKPELIGFRVQVSYDPMKPETITVSYKGIEPFTAQPVKIGSFCAKKPSLPVSMLEQQPTTSRFLDALERRHEERRQTRMDAISFASYSKKEGDDNV